MFGLWQIVWRHAANCHSSQGSRLPKALGDPSEGQHEKWRGILRTNKGGGGGCTYEAYMFVVVWVTDGDPRVIDVRLSSFHGHVNTNACPYIGSSG